MALSKTDILQKIVSGTMKVTWCPGDTFAFSKCTKELLLEAMEKGVNLNPKEFVFAINFLLAGKSTFLEESLAIYIRTKSEFFSHLHGFGLYLINLNDDGTFWGPTSLGLSNNTIPGWIARQSFILETSLILNFRQEYRHHDPRLWVVANLILNQKKIRPDLIYQSSECSVKEYYDDVEKIRIQVTRIRSDEPGPRMIFAPAPVPPSRVTTQFSFPKYSSDNVTLPTPSFQPDPPRIGRGRGVTAGLKRAGETPLQGSSPKRARH